MGERTSMNIIKHIKVENIKGKDLLKINFDNLTANQPNIIVAPNGYGKSTIAAAFKASTHGKIKLDPKDTYQQNPANHPKLEIEFKGEFSGIFTATDESNDISRQVLIDVIDSPLYAKSTTRRFGPGTTSSADLRIEDIIVCSKVPNRYSLEYSYRRIKQSFGNKGKLFLNISEMLDDYDNIVSIFGIKDTINKCISLVAPQRMMNRFLDDCQINGTALNSKNLIPIAKVNELRNNEHLKILLDCVQGMKCKPVEWQEIDVVFTAIQLCKIISNHYENGNRDIINKIYQFHQYKKLRTTIDNRLDNFNTTGRTIRSVEKNGKLMVTFDRADSLSNGERDVLSFVVNITKFEHSFSKPIGILIIDEVFDYLDGSNMLAVQYYMNNLICNCKSSGKTLFPIILTHLDPESFSNYYFKKKKVHYISAHGQIDLNSNIVKMLRLREETTLTAAQKEEIEKYYIHYIDESHTLSQELSNQIAVGFSDSNETFREKLYDEIKNKYLEEQTYNPIMVIAGLRIKIEEKVYNMLPPDCKVNFISEHKVINKLKYAIDKGADVPELLFLLQPLYNDGLHLGGNDDSVRNKIKSAYLKTDNLHIRRMIGMIFS